MIDRLVADGIRRHGRFDGRPGKVNPLAEAGIAARPIHRMRLKEWVGFVVLHPDLWASMIIQDAKFLASSDFITFRGHAGATRHEAVGRPRTARLPSDLFGGRASFSRPGYHINYTFGDAHGRHRIRVDAEANGAMPEVHVDLDLDPATTPPPLSVSSPLPGPHAGGILPPSTMYTYKKIYSASGTIRLGDDEYTCDPSRDLAIIDEHRSSLPYRTRWVWGTFATHLDGGIVGANFAHRPKVIGSEEESCLWTPDAAEPLADVDFDHDPLDPMGRWHIHSRDGRLDVTFQPANREEVRQQLGIFAIDYFMMQGTYSGTVVGTERTYEIRDAHGVCERMHARL